MADILKISYKIFFFFFFLLSSIFNTAKAQSPAIYWQQFYGGSKIDFLGLIKKTTDHGFIMAGNGLSTDGDFSGTGNGGSDLEVLKLDVCGRKIWSKITGGNSIDLLYAINETTEQGVLVSGYTSSTNLSNGYHGGASDAIVCKLDANGNTLWQKTFGGTNADFLYNSIFFSDSSCIIAGFTSSTDGDGGPQSLAKTGWVLKLDKNGNVIWKNFLGSTGSVLYDIVASGDGGFLICGTTNITGSSDVLLVKIDSAGNQIWEKNYGGSGADFPYSMKKTDNGGYILNCNTKSFDGDVTGNHGDQDAWVIYVDANGNLIWQKCLGGSGFELMRSVNVLPDGNYIFSGYSNSVDGDITQNSGQSVAFAFCLNTTGTLLWTKCHGGSTRDEFYGAESNPDGSILLSGFTNSSDGDITGNHSTGDFMLLKLFNKKINNIDTSYCKPILIDNILFTGDTVYIDTIKDICNYDSAYIKYNIIVKPETIKTINDTSIGFREPIVLTSTASGTVTWSGVGLSCYNCLAPVAKPQNSLNTYIVKTGTGNCITSDTVIISVRATDTLYIPSAFTPNGDGKNDIFNALGIVSDFSMDIFNRWGEKIFTTKSLLTGWDGSYKGKEQGNGIFIYFIKYKTQSQKIKQLKGTFNLFR